jgi:PAS domain S-box-containing protein
MSRVAPLHSMTAAWNGSPPRSVVMRWLRSRSWMTFLAVLFAGAVFAIDALMPANGALAILYVLSIAIVLGSQRPATVIAMGLFCSVLTIAGYFVGDPMVARSEEIVQRGAALIGIGLMGWIGWQLVGLVETAHQLRVDACLREVAEEAATFFRTMVDAVPIGISRTDLNGQFVFVNEEFCRIFERSADDLLGMPEKDLCACFHSEPPRSAIRRVVDLGKSEDRIERLIKGGQEHFMKVIRTPIKDAHARTVGVQAVWLDVTELQRAQDRLERYTRNLERSNVDLQQFAYVASHDLQEPLRAISSYCQLLEKRFASQLDEQAQRWLQFVISGAKRMQTLVHDLLTYSRVDNKTETWITTESRIACQLAIENLEPVIAEAGAQITVDALPIVWADDTQLQMVFQNLIGNALKFRGERPLQIEISAQPGNGEWIFSVRDNGIGIKPEFHERVFEIFKRLNVSDRYPGTGIGLAICKRIVERYGGRIWVNSEFGVGSTFFFSLPSPQPTDGVHHASSSDSLDDDATSVDRR